MGCLGWPAPCGGCSRLAAPAPVCLSVCLSVDVCIAVRHHQLLRNHSFLNSTAGTITLGPSLKAAPTPTRHPPAARPAPICRPPLVLQDTVHTVQAMKAAGTEMKGFMKQNDLKIENIEKLHDDMSDMLVGAALLPCWPVALGWVGLGWVGLGYLLPAGRWPIG